MELFTSDSVEFLCLTKAVWVFPQFIKVTLCNSNSVTLTTVILAKEEQYMLQVLIAVNIKFRMPSKTRSASSWYSPGKKAIIDNQI